MTPSEQALFSSNREKSPVPASVDGGASTDNESTANSLDQPQSERNIISASTRNDTANKKLVGNNL